jgi:hypothetical protein
VLAKNRPDLLAGLLLIGLAAFAAYFLWPLPFGTAARAGAGFVPLGTAAILAALGAIILISGIFGAAEAIEPGRTRPVLAVLGAIAAFALLVERAGLPLAVFAAALVAALARRGEFDARGAAFAAALAALCTAAFKYGLNLPFKLVP